MGTGTGRLASLPYGGQLTQAAARLPGCMLNRFEHARLTLPVHASTAVFCTPCASTGLPCQPGNQPHALLLPKSPSGAGAQWQENCETGALRRQACLFWNISCRLLGLPATVGHPSRAATLPYSGPRAGLAPVAGLGPAAQRAARSRGRVTHVGALSAPDELF